MSNTQTIQSFVAHYNTTARVDVLVASITRSFRYAQSVLAHRPNDSDWREQAIALRSAKRAATRGDVARAIVILRSI